MGIKYNYAMKKNLLFEMLSVVLFLAGCSADDTVGQLQPVELKLSTSVESGLEVEVGATRSTLTQNTGFDTNPAQTIAVYSVTKGATTGTPKGITASTTPVNTGFYWPPTGARIDIYGWYPVDGTGGVKTSGTPTALNATTTTFTIQSNQADVANYRKSDLMFASKTDQPHVNGVLAESKELVFAHKLSRVQVVLSPNTATGVQATDLADAKITIANVVSRVKIESLTAPTVTPQTGTTTTLTLCENYNTSTANAYAIVPPQTMTGKTLTVALKGGATLTAALPTSTLAANGAYKYTVTVAATQLTVTASITKWGDETSAGSVTGYY